MASTERFEADELAGEGDGGNPHARFSEDCWEVFVGSVVPVDLRWREMGSSSGMTRVKRLRRWRRLAVVATFFGAAVWMFSLFCAVARISLNSNIEIINGALNCTRGQCGEIALSNTIVEQEIASWDSGQVFFADDSGFMDLSKIGITHFNSIPRLPRWYFAASSGTILSNPDFWRCTRWSVGIPNYWSGWPTEQRSHVYIPTGWFFIPPLAAWLFVTWRLRRRVRPGHCLACAYDLTGNVSGICPECGEAAASSAF